MSKELTLEELKKDIEEDISESLVSRMETALLVREKLNILAEKAHTLGRQSALGIETENTLLKAVADVTLHIQPNDEILIGLGDAQNAISDTLSALRETK